MNNEYLAKLLQGNDAQKSGFYQTEAGRKFVNKTLPSLSLAVKSLNETINKHTKCECLNKKELIRLQENIKRLAKMEVSTSDFYRTRLGRLYYEKYIPELIESINKLSEAIEKDSLNKSCVEELATGQISIEEICPTILDD